MAEPRIVSTWSFSTRGCAQAIGPLLSGGAAIDAVEAVCTAAEDDETVDSVGYGGLPDADGAVTLDAVVMLSPARRGAVCAVERCRNVARLARMVMERTPHVLVAGAGADRFAERQGLGRDALVAPVARDRWEAWRRDPHPVDQSQDSGAMRPFDRGVGALFHGEPPHDTIGVLAIDADGTLAGGCSTSGMPYKLPGRVGDSPIVGHGLYVEPGIGAVTATGHGELISGICGSFLAVEHMRRGATPAEALHAVVRRAIASYALRDDDQVAFVALRADGAWAAAALRSGFRAVVADAAGVRVEDVPGDA